MRIYLGLDVASIFNLDSTAQASSGRHFDVLN